MSAILTGKNIFADLNIRNLSFSIGDLNILKDINLECNSATVTGLIGPNGAGKTTLLNCISGLYQPTSGEISLNKISLVGKRCYQVSRIGVGRTFQTPQVIEDLTVMDNVMIGGQVLQKQKFFRQGFSMIWDGHDEEVLRERAYESLKRVGLTSALDKPIAECSHIERRLIEIARAICGSPSLLLLDEPCAGMSQVGRQILSETITSLASDKVTILLVEHNVSFVAKVSSTIAVLDQGVIIEKGTPGQVLNSEKVKEAYLGHKK
jgi:ABC-type branched-subunit amino acid transport system ATPase component